MEQIETVVIGAGAVGLAVARALARSGREVLLLEAAGRIGSGSSSRSSEVMHAGIYYPTGSLKARLCVRGQALLLDYCRTRSVPHRLVGKLLVATDAEQRPALAALQARARANGVTELQPLDAAEAQALEPALRCVAALHSPGTGIFDSHAYLLALLADAEAHGATLVTRAPVTGGCITAGGFELQVGGAAPLRLRAREVVNAAGHWAPALARRLGLPEAVAAALPRAWFCKGHYASCTGRPAFSRLIYPMPDAAGLGVHVTLDLAGGLRFGPDTQWIEPVLRPDAPFPPLDALDYGIDPPTAERVLAEMSRAIRRYWPALPDGALQPAYSGIRPKISGPADPAADFRLDGPAEHGVAGLVQLYGIESPGLTASLAIAEQVLAQLDGGARVVPNA